MANLRTLEGADLTPEALEQLANEAEAGLDLDTWKRVRRGRPSLGKSGQSPRLQIRLDEDLSQALHDRAEKENRSISEISREALRKYIEAPIKRP
ncbi:MAG: CopG family transcriptional regulator [Solirubrobacterales bacterium]